MNDLEQIDRRYREVLVSNLDAVSRATYLADVRFLLERAERMLVELERLSREAACSH